MSDREVAYEEALWRIEEAREYRREWLDFRDLPALNEARGMHVILNYKQEKLFKDIAQAISKKEEIFSELFRDISNGLSDIHEGLKRVSQSFARSTAGELIIFLATVAGGLKAAIDLGLTLEFFTMVNNWIIANASTLFELAKQYGDEVLEKATATIKPLIKKQ